MRTTISPFAPLSPLTYHTLAALTARPLHAYALQKQIIHDSHLSVTPALASLHHTLKNLAHHNWLERLDQQPDGKIRYQLTTTGQKVFAQELARLKHAITVGDLAQAGLFTWN